MAETNQREVAGVVVVLINMAKLILNLHQGACHCLELISELKFGA